MEFQHEAIFCIVNDGYSEAVMDAAKKHGARGGTVISARGTAPKDAEKFFNMTIQPDKEIVLILVESELVDGILKGLYTAIGSSTEAQGIAFALPVDEVIGLGTQKPNA